MILILKPIRLFVFLAMFLLLTYFIDSVIGKMFTSTSICYDGKDLEEPLGGVPTVSLILQVTTQWLYLYLQNTPIFGFFLKLEILNPFMLRLS